MPDQTFAGRLIHSLDAISRELRALDTALGRNTAEIAETDRRMIRWEIQSMSDQARRLIDMVEKIGSGE